jgi:hypothetical protein
MVGGGDDAGVECVSEAAGEEEEGITRQKSKGTILQQERRVKRRYA